MNATHHGAAPTSTAAPTPQSVPKIWLTVNDVAKLLSIGVRTVFRLTAQGQIPQPVRLSAKLIRWDREVLLQFARDMRADHERGQEGGRP